MPISWRRENDGFIMTHKLKTEMFSQKIEYSGGVFFSPLTPLFSFVSFHLKNPVSLSKNIFSALNSFMNTYDISVIYLQSIEKI